MEDHIFKDCFNHYLNSKKGASYWDELATKYKSVCHGKAENLRAQFKAERKKRGIVPKGQVTETSNIGEKIGDALENTDEEEDVNYKNTEKINEDGSIYSDKLIRMSDEDKRSPERLLELHGFDKDLWEVVSCINNYWHMARPKDLGHLLMYQSKLTARPKKSTGITFIDIEKFFENFIAKKVSISTRSNRSSYDEDGLCLEVDLADIHVGNRGVNHIESKSIEDKFYTTIDDIFETAKTKKLSLIYLVNLGDLFHFDTFKNNTTGGTQIDTNGMTYAEIFDLGAKMMIYAIDKFSTLAPLEFISIPGNHDKTFSYFLVKAIEFYYKDNADIYVDTGHQSRKYRLFGNSLIGFAHGDINKNKIASLPSIEAKEEWGKAKFVEMHSGHIHSQTVIESNNVICRTLPTMTDMDLWSYDKGFVGSIKSTVSCLWSKDRGLRQMWFSNI